MAILLFDPASQASLSWNFSSQHASGAFGLRVLIGAIGWCVVVAAWLGGVGRAGTEVWWIAAGETGREGGDGGGDEGKNERG